MTAATGVLPPSLRQVVVIAPTWLGDTVMATPLLAALRSARPDARITVVHEPGLRGVLDGHPAVDATIGVRGKGLAGPWRTARRLRGLKPDAVLLLPNSLRSALGPWLARVPLRIGRDRDGRTPLLTHAQPAPRHESPVPTWRDYAQLAHFAFGVDPQDTPTSLAVTGDERAAADAALAPLSEKPFVLIVPGASKPAKRWPAERFAHLADAVRGLGLEPVVAGAPAERPILDRVIATATGPILDLARSGLDLGGLKAVIARAAVVVTNDTGPRHLAAALGTPLVSLFGPTDQRWTILPGVHERRLLAEPFLPNDLVADRHAKLCAIERIPVADVVAAVEAVTAGG